MKPLAIPYPCVGCCIIDSRGYCVGCGRPPTLGAPENCAVGKRSKDPDGLQAPSEESVEAAGPDNLIRSLFD